MSNSASPPRSPQLPLGKPGLPPGSTGTVWMAGMQALSGGSLRFAFADVTESDRIPVFREVFGRQIMQIRRYSVADVPFHIGLKFQAMPELTMMSGRAINRATSARATRLRPIPPMTSACW